MSGIGDDIKDVLAELGSPITIIKMDGTLITGEYIDPENNYKHSTDFIRQNVWTCDLQFDSQVEDGDVLDIGFAKLLVMNIKPTVFEQEFVIKNAFLVTVNCLGHFAEPTTTRVNMEKTVVWAATREGVYGVQTEHIRNPSYQLTDEVEEAAVREILYVPKYAEIQLGSRWYPDSLNLAEYYKVVNISTRVYAGLYRIYLEKDNRE